MKIGITEQGDASLDFSWVEKLATVDGAIIITKNLTDKCIDELLKAKTPCIVHCTCTGWGGTIIEPNVPDYKTQLNQLKKLIDKGFDAKRCVLRLDPIIPTKEGLEKVQNVLTYFTSLNLEVDRIRISIMDEYNHVKQRLMKNGLTSFYGDSFYASTDMIRNAANVLEQYDLFYETCAEKLLSKFGTRFIDAGCVSKMDLTMMGLECNEEMLQNMQQRSGCRCLSCKKELLSNKKQCPYKCIYCYWKGDE